MIRTILKSKVKKLFISSSSIHYNGSIALPDEIIEAANLKIFEQVHVNNLTNGNRIITYVIRSNQKGYVTINGAASKLFSKGDEIHILSYVQMSDEKIQDFKPILIITNKLNEVIEITNYSDLMEI